ncbi:aldo/keto reductase [Nocardioides conyzicola]|uniref:Aldo/keto reductase n=1 Tax=Nocardioides conyzicola TaxID=1651781 RepID=A0ABP8X236_9ACTN
MSTKLDRSASIREAIPPVGLGTWPLKGDTAYRIVLQALEMGYRHLDTATYYGNEEQIGRALRSSGLRRDEVFITTKMPQGNAGRERATIEESLQALQVDAVDLWLVHWPPAGKSAPDTWAEFLRARDDGLARFVGVSNYDVSQLDELTAAHKEAPALNQIRYGPSLHSQLLLTEHERRGIVVAGWSPFKSTNLAHPVLVRIADNHGMSAAQVVVRWHIQHGVICLPRSTNVGRLRSNRDVDGLVLTPEQITAIDKLAD